MKLDFFDLLTCRPEGKRGAVSRSYSGLFHVLVAALLLGGLLGLGACASGPPPTAREMGERALAEGDWRGALVHFEAALKADPKDARAWHGQAEAGLAGRNPEAALKSLVELAAVDGELFRGAARPTYADALAGATRDRLRRGQAEASLVSARALAELEPNRNGVRRLLSEALLVEGDHLRLRGETKRAYELFGEATRADPSRLEAWIGAAELLIEAGDGKGAVRLLEAARKHHPTAGEIRTLSIQALHAR